MSDNPVYVKLTNELSDDNKPTDNKTTNKKMFQDIDANTVGIVSIHIAFVSMIPILLFYYFFERYTKPPCFGK